LCSCNFHNMILECIKYIINFTMGIENIEAKGKKPVGEFQGNMVDAAKPFIDSVPEIGSLLGAALFSPLAFFFQ